MNNNKDILFKNRCYGIMIIKSENSNFNADFTGSPRRLPNEEGTIYATDKALKYAIRKFWIDNDEKVFVWKTFKKKDDAEEYVPFTLEQRFQNMQEILIKEGHDKDKVASALYVFSKCIDTKLFGITFAMKAGGGRENKNISLTGPVQISYGVNRMKQNIVYSNDIMSPYPTEEGKASTLGSEMKAAKVYYVYDFVINPSNITNHYEQCEEVKEMMAMKKSDIDRLMKAFNNAVTNMNSTTKIGSENVLTLLVTLNKDSQIQIPMMKNMVSIDSTDDKDTIDLSSINSMLKQDSIKNNIGQKVLYRCVDESQLSIEGFEKEAIRSAVQ